MMLREQQFVLPVELRRELLQLAAQQVFLKQLLADPERNRRGERAKTTRRERDIGFEQPLELQERLLVEDDIVDFLERDLRMLEAITDRVLRIARIVLDACEALLLGRGNNATVDQQRGRAVVRTACR
jgi:hypothetical protein